jgi:hypothetical protein
VNRLPPSSDGIDEIVATIGVCAALRYESPTFLQPAALPTELPGNLVEPKRAHSSINWWGGSEHFLQEKRIGRTTFHEQAAKEQFGYA